MAVAPTQETVNKLLDFNQKLDISLLDSVIGTLYGGTGEQQKMAQDVLTTLKEHPDAWTKVSLWLWYLIWCFGVFPLEQKLTFTNRTDHSLVFHFLFFLSLKMLES